jgi:nucleoid-associated protein YgaU
VRLKAFSNVQRPVNLQHLNRSDGVVAQALTLPESTQRPTPAPSATTPEIRQIPSTHEVRPGDSLYGISMRYYGSADQIQAIFQANRDILRSVNDLRPGQLLKLPR